MSNSYNYTNNQNCSKLNCSYIPRNASINYYYTAGYPIFNLSSIQTLGSSASQNMKMSMQIQNSKYLHNTTYKIIKQNNRQYQSISS